MQLPSIQLQRRSGDPVPVGGRTLAPETLTLVIRWLGVGYVWNWPIAVHVTQDGHTQRLPIVDITKGVQLGLWLLTGLATIAFLAATFRRKDISHG